MRSLLLILMALALLLVSGCVGGSTNPREGGLFSYNPEAYEARQRQRQQELDAIRQEQIQEEAEAARLVQEKQQKTAQISRQQRQLNALNTEMNAVQKKIHALKNGSDAQKAQS